MQEGDMKVDWLIVGAGFTGLVLAERIASQLDKKVLVVEQRNHIGGNAYDHYDDNGILVHRYGPHLFHTNSEKVWRYLSQFTEWHPYYHRVLALVDGKKVPVPFNLNSLYAVFATGYASKLEELLLKHYGLGSKVPILKLRREASGESSPEVSVISSKSKLALIAARGPPPPSLALPSAAPLAAPYRGSACP